MSQEIIITEVNDSKKTCWGCLNDIANQEGHMDEGGCLYEKALSIDYFSDEDIDSGDNENSDKTPELSKKRKLESKILYTIYSMNIDIENPINTIKIHDGDYSSVNEASRKLVEMKKWLLSERVYVIVQQDTWVHMPNLNVMSFIKIDVNRTYDVIIQKV